MNECTHDKPRPDNAASATDERQQREIERQLNSAMHVLGLIDRSGYSLVTCYPDVALAMCVKAIKHLNDAQTELAELLWRKRGW